MASINEVTIDLKFTGLNNLEQATKKMRQVQTEVKRLAKEERAGSISSQQYAKRVDQLSKELSKIAKGNRNAANSVVLYSKQVRAGIKAEEDSKKAAEANKIAQQQLEQVRKKNAFIVAMQEQRLKEEARAAKESASANAALQAEEERLKRKYVEGYAAMDIYSKEMNDLAVARKAGIISAQQQRAEVEKLNIALANGSLVGRETGRGMNRLGVLFQQTGYQVGDFAVQVQSGTHFMVALGQQATQLVGTFAMLAKSTRLIAIFSGLGIVIPIATAVIGAFMRANENMEDSVDKSNDKVNELSQTISRLNNNQKTVASDFQTGLNAAFEESASAVGRLLERLREAEFAAAMEPVERVTRQIEFNVDAAVANYDRLVQISSMTDFERFLARVSDEDIRNMQALVKENMNLIQAQDELRASLDAISQSQTTEELITNFSQALTLAESLGGPAADAIVQGLIDAAREAGLYEEIMQRAEQATKDSADATEKAAEALQRQVTHQMQIATLQKEINDGVNEILASRNAELQKQQDRITLAQTELQFGKESQEYRNAQLTIEERILREQLAQNGILGNNAQKIVDAWREASNLEQAVADARDAAFDLADEIGEAATNALKLAGIDITSGVNSAAAAAKALAIRLGASVDAALALINIEGGMKQQSGPRRESGRTLPQVTANVPGSLGEAYRRSMELGEFAKDTGGGAADQKGIGSLAQSLLTQQEKIDMWYEESLVKLEEFNAKELKILGGHAEARLRIESEYQSRILDLQQQQYQGVTTAQQRAMGAFQGFMSTIAGQSEGAAKAVLVINTALSISQAIQNTAVAATRALAELGPVLGPPAAAKIKMYGAAQVGLIAANAALRFAGSGSGGGGGAIGGGIGAPASPTAAVTSQAPAAPQRVIIEGLDRDSLISGEQLQNIFDKLYEENEDRGFVFQVAR